MTRIERVTHHLINDKDKVDVLRLADRERWATGSRRNPRGER